MPTKLSDYHFCQCRFRRTSPINHTVDVFMRNLNIYGTDDFALLEEVAPYLIYKYRKISIAKKAEVYTSALL
ncbi:hypothetical protein [Pedobacter helvus]|uniref:hypothetical protein n=1 Tax=Pedobacter helvus TaxID=2563444 RepID=UPI0038FC5D43